METQFWLDKWQNNELGFHQMQVNKTLAEHFAALEIPEGSRIFVPLCGKTLDMAWLLEQGYRVVGIELSPIAIEDFFKGMDVIPEVSKVGPLTRYSARNVDLYGGDIFDLDKDILGKVDAIYDRAALVALPDEMRRRYAEHMTAITGKAPQFLLCFEYDQSLMKGPPFSIESPIVRDLYEGLYTAIPITRTEIPGGFKGEFPASESLWILR
ncbi:MAG: thiopurine S-methyltransferase [Sneathiellales bacterium]|nr:thiopurine S-methyltransferase [Sneathiellales bacterium]